MKARNLLIMLSAITLGVHAQTTQPKHLNLGVGFGAVNPLGINKNIYYDYGSCAKYMIEAEKGITKKGAIQSGIQFQILSMSMDAVLNQDNKLTQAPDSIKYASINQLSLQIPIRYRFYNTEAKDGKFYQIGATLGYSFNNTYAYRYKNENKDQTINQVQPFQCMVHLGLGRRVSTKHIVYMDWSIPVTPFFKQANSSSLYPMQLSFNILL